MLYYKHKLVRFTGVPLKVSGVWRLTKTNSGLKQTNVPQGWARNSRKATERSFFFVGYGKIVEKENKMNQEGKFISHEEGPIKYIEISNAPKENAEETAEPAETAETVDKRTQTLRNVGKKALAVVLTAAAVGAFGAVGSKEVEGARPMEEQEYKDAMDRQLSGKEQVVITYEKDGSRISFVEGGQSQYSMSDANNDTMMERGSLTRGGQTVNFEVEEGVPVEVAENILNQKFN